MSNASRRSSDGTAPHRHPLARPLMPPSPLPELTAPPAPKPEQPNKSVASPKIYHEPDDQSDGSRPHRSPWRQRWVDTERGWTHSFRSESSFFFHFFIASLAFCVAFVIGINFFEWAILMLCFAFVLSAELFQCALHRISRLIGPGSPPNAPSAARTQTDQALTELSRIGTAAVMTANLGAALATTLIFSSHLIAWLRREHLLTFLP